MLLCLDIGNSQIYGGVYKNSKCITTFRYPTTSPFTSDSLGVFFTSVFSQYNLSHFEGIAMCSVVPSITQTIINACETYIHISPFVLNNHFHTSDISFGSNLGTDRIANLLGAYAEYPHENIVIVDFGTATTLCTLSKDHLYRGGAILPGLTLMAKSLSAYTSQLPMLSFQDFPKSPDVLPNTTLTQIQSGLFYAHVGLVNIQLKTFTKKYPNPRLFLTGGLGHLFQSQWPEAVYEPYLIFKGLQYAINFSESQQIF